MTRDVVRVYCRACVLLLAASSVALAQHRVDSRQLYERAFIVCKMTGAGTYDDPIRPAFAPKPSEMDPTAPDKIAGFSYVMSDDGKFAIMQIVARDKHAFQSVLNAPGVQAFVRGQAKEADVLSALRKLRKKFDLSEIDVVVP